MKRVLIITAPPLIAILLAAGIQRPPPKVGINVPASTASAEPRADEARPFHHALPNVEDVEEIHPISDSELTIENTDRILEAASESAKFNPEQTAAWAQKIEPVELREQTLASIAITWADQDPIAAARLLLQNTQPSQLQHNAAIGILQRLARKDTEAAEQWASQFPLDLQETAHTQLHRIHDRLDSPSSPLQ